MSKILSMRCLISVVIVFSMSDIRQKRKRINAIFLTYCVINFAMTNNFVPADKTHVQREKSKARKLRHSQWWRQQIGSGTCYYCHEKFKQEGLTMDHIVPIIRGGTSAKSNIVVSCKACNSKKKYFTPVELTLQAMSAKKPTNSFES